MLSSILPPLHTVSQEMPIGMDVQFVMISVGPANIPILIFVNRVMPFSIGTWTPPRTPCSGGAWTDLPTIGGPGVAGYQTGMQLTQANTDITHNAYRLIFTAVASGASFHTTATTPATLQVTMDGAVICNVAFTEAFDLDICGDDGLLEAR